MYIGRQTCVKRIGGFALFGIYAAGNNATLGTAVQKDCPLFFPENAKKMRSALTHSSRVRIWYVEGVN